jgi:hypothetical protein
MPHYLWTLHKIGKVRNCLRVFLLRDVPCTVLWDGWLFSLWFKIAHANGSSKMRARQRSCSHVSFHYRSEDIWDSWEICVLVSTASPKILTLLLPSQCRANLLRCPKATSVPGRLIVHITDQILEDRQHSCDRAVLCQAGHHSNSEKKLRAL